MYQTIESLFASAASLADIHRRNNFVVCNSFNFFKLYQTILSCSPNNVCYFALLYFLILTPLKAYKNRHRHIISKS
jgi:hypothetical protein